MGPSPTCHPPEGEECETSVEHGLPLWAEPAVRYCSRRPRPSPMWGSRFVGARAVGPWMGEQKLRGKTPLGGNPCPEKTCLPTFFFFLLCWSSLPLRPHCLLFASPILSYFIPFPQHLKEWEEQKIQYNTIQYNNSTSKAKVISKLFNFLFCAEIPILPSAISGNWRLFQFSKR